jgi:predicted ester cyclase
MYRSVFPDLEIEVVDQVVEGDRVVSRWKARGTNRGRRASLDGITISHIEDGKIVEDWGVSDNLSLLRHLGPWRVAALGVGQLRDRLAGRASRV